MSHIQDKDFDLMSGHPADIHFSNHLLPDLDGELRMDLSDINLAQSTNQQSPMHHNSHHQLSPLPHAQLSPLPHVSPYPSHHQLSPQPGNFSATTINNGFIYNVNVEVGFVFDQNFRFLNNFVPAKVHPNCSLRGEFQQREVKHESKTIIKGSLFPRHPGLLRLRNLSWILHPLPLLHQPGG